MTVYLYRDFEENCMKIFSNLEEAKTIAKNEEIIRNMHGIAYLQGEHYQINELIVDDNLWEEM